MSYACLSRVWTRRVSAVVNIGFAGNAWADLLPSCGLVECGGGALHPPGRLPSVLRRERASSVCADPERVLHLR